MFHYVYILTSQKHTSKTYVGYTNNLHKRLKAHNSGASRHTSKYLPWKIQTAIAVDSKPKALALEKYLKSHSGKAFCSRHL